MQDERARSGSMCLSWVLVAVHKRWTKRRPRQSYPFSRLCSTQKARHPITSSEARRYLVMELTVMKTHVIRKTVCLLLLASGLIAGCDAGFIRDEAQRSFATFLSGVVTTAINETINPDN